MWERAENGQSKVIGRQQRTRPVVPPTFATAASIMCSPILYTTPTSRFTYWSDKNTYLYSVKFPRKWIKKFLGIVNIKRILISIILHSNDFRLIVGVIRLRTRLLAAAHLLMWSYHISVDGMYSCLSKSWLGERKWSPICRFFLPTNESDGRWYITRLSVALIFPVKSTVFELDSSTCIGILVIFLIRIRSDDGRKTIHTILWRVTCLYGVASITYQLANQKKNFPFQAKE